MVSTFIWLSAAVERFRVLNVFKIFILMCRIFKRSIVLWMYILLEVVEVGFFCFFKISTIRNSKFKVVTEVFIALIIRRELRCLFVYKENTAFKDLRYWLTLSIRSILSLESDKWTIMLLNIVLKFVKDFS